MLSTTRITIVVEAQTQCGPFAAIRMVTGRLSGADIPAISSVEVLKAETNYRLYQEPSAEFYPVKV